jgi:aspartate/methionine/tyrosine aminotransferase
MTYSPLFKRKLDPENEIIVTAGANEGELLALERISLKEIYLMRQYHPGIFAILAGYLDQGKF